MVQPPDPRAEKVRQRKSRKNTTRAVFGEAVKLFISGRATPVQPVSEECQRCIAKQGAA